MAIKAGRVGVAPNQVDEFGNINSEVTSGYTKQEADAKFETQTHASSTYETKSDAAALQPKNLAVPISMLDGSQLVPKTTVESVIATMNEAMTNKDMTDLLSVKTETITAKEGYSIHQNTFFKKSGNVVTLGLMMPQITANANAWVQVAVVSSDCIPKGSVYQGFFYGAGGAFGQIQITLDGIVQLYPHTSLSNTNVFANLAWCV